MSTDDDWAAAMAEQALEEANAVGLDELVDDSQPISKA
ncbi:MAG: flagellar motor switch protein FliN, partial [Shewanella sp.]